MGESIDLDLLNREQGLDYSIIDHLKSRDNKKNSLRMIVSGTAGTWKSFFIIAARQLLRDKVKVTAWKAPFNVSGITAHFLLALRVKS